MIAAGMGKVLKQAARGPGPAGDRARNGHVAVGKHPDGGQKPDDRDPELGFDSGAGDRDRTGMTSLEGCGQQASELLLPRSEHVYI